MGHWLGKVSARGYLSPVFQLCEVEMGSCSSQPPCPWQKKGSEVPISFPEYRWIDLFTYFR